MKATIAYVLYAALLCMHLPACGGCPPPVPRVEFTSWDDYATGFCEDIAERLPRLALEHTERDAGLRNWFAVVTSGIAIVGTVATTALLGGKADDQDPDLTEPIVTASITGASTLTGLISSAVIGDGSGKKIEIANQRQNEIRDLITEYREKCPIGAATLKCKQRALELARRCDNKRNGADLRLDQDRYPPPWEVEGLELPYSVDSGTGPAPTDGGADAGRPDAGT